MQYLSASLALAFAAPVLAPAPAAQPVTVVADIAPSAAGPEGARTARSVEIRAAELRTAARDRSPIRVEAGEQRLVASPTRVTLRPGGGVSWFGATEDGGRVTLTLEGDWLVGRVVTPSGLVVIEPLDGGHVAYVPGPYPEERDDALPAPPDGAPWESGSVEVLFPDELHLMIVYTPAVASVLGATLPAFMQAGEDVVNDVLQNSLVPFRARVVHTQLLPYDESGTMSTDLARIRSTSDGHMDEVHALRTAFSVDLVALIVQNAPSSCGVAYLMDPVRPEFQSSGFSVTRRSCAIGNLTFPHELGHNLGLRHDRFVDQANTPFTYSHGYVNDDSLGPGQAGLRTTLSYNDQCTSQGGTCTRVPYFSDPALTFGGQILGDSLLAHNARAAAFSLPTVAAFRSATLLATDGGNTAGAAFFRRPDCPDPTDLSLCTVGDSVRYQMRSLQSAALGLHHVRADAGHDAVLLLYRNGFDPDAPTAGLIAYAEPDTSAPALRRLMASTAVDPDSAYVIVMAGRAEADAGPYDLEVYGPAGGGVIVRSADSPEASDELAIGPPVPNPFREGSVLTVAAASAQTIRAELFDVLGRRVAVLFDGPVGARTPVAVRLDGAGLAPGAYGVRISGSTFTRIVPVTRMR